jgi:hypothetical protein
LQADLDALSNSNGKIFETRWLELMHKMQMRKITLYNSAIDNSKDDKVKSAALAILPRAKLGLESIKRVMENKGPAESTDPNTQKRTGDDNINRKNADR